VPRRTTGHGGLIAAVTVAPVHRRAARQWGGSGWWGGASRLRLFPGAGRTAKRPIAWFRGHVLAFGGRGPAQDERPAGAWRRLW
jgi:hypothetical protein